MDVRITFGFIVLNEKPFIIPNMKYLYEFAHEIIVVEGACEAARSVAREDGHSLDGTFEALRQLKAQSDPDDKIRIITAADAGSASGFWPDKNAMSRAYADRATGNYLWQIDGDEFYMENDIRRVMAILSEDSTDTVSFETKTFFGGLDYELDGFYMRRDLGNIVHRIFRWEPGYQYKTHWPPTIINEAGVDLRTLRWLKPAASARLGIFMYHYCYLFPQQVSNKMAYYEGVRALKYGEKRSMFGQYAELFAKGRTSPFRVSSVPGYLSWVRRYRGEHPKAILDMSANLGEHSSGIQLRDNSDVEKWLRSPAYLASAFTLEMLARLQSHEPFRLMSRIWRRLWRLFFRAKPGSQG